MNMVEVKTAELSGSALDWAVAHAVKAWESAHELFPTMTLDPTFSGVEARPYPSGEYGTMLQTCVLIPNNPFRQDPQSFCPSSEWSHGGPLIDRRITTLCSPRDGYWWAHAGNHLGEGGSALIAACRAIVAAKLGDTVQVPAELVEEVA